MFDPEPLGKVVVTVATPCEWLVKLLQLVPPFRLYLHVVVDIAGVIVRYDAVPCPVVVIALLVTVRVTPRFFFPVTVNRAAFVALYATLDVADLTIEPNVMLLSPETVTVCPIITLSMNMIIANAITTRSHVRDEISEAAHFMF